MAQNSEIKKLDQGDIEALRLNAGQENRGH
jgi:hypothetical protein